MGLKIYFFIFFIFFCIGRPLSQNTFCVSIGGPSSEDGTDIVQTDDGGFAVVGTTYGYGAGSTDIYLAKLDDNANLLFTKTFGDISFDNGNSLIKTKDGGLLILGTTSSSANWDEICLLKLNSQGIIQWEKTYGGLYSDRSIQIIHTNDDGYAILGETNSYGWPLSCVYVIKIDSYGNIQWTRTISRGSGVNGDNAASIVQTTDGGFAITGNTPGSSGKEDLFLIKLKYDGVLEWTKLIGIRGDVRDEGQAIIRTLDGGYAIGGQINAYSNDSAGFYRNTYLIKLDSNFAIQWSKQFGPIFRTTSLIQNSQGNFVILGNRGNSILIKKIDENGVIIWAKKIVGQNGPNYDWASKIIQTTDFGYALVGSDFTISSFERNVYVMKLDSSGNGCCTLPDSSISVSLGTDTFISVIVDTGCIVGNVNWIVNTGGNDTVLCSIGCAMPIANAGNDVNICSGTSSTLHGTGGINYFWYPSNNLSNPNISDPIASPSVTTTYYLVLTNSCGSDTDSVTVFVIDPIAEILASDTTICSGQSIQLTVTGGDSYLWNTGDTTSSIIVLPDSSTIYFATTSIGICSDADSVNINVLPSPSIQINGNDFICFGDSAIFTATGADTYLWSTNQTTPTITVNPTMTDSFFVIGNLNNGCSDSSKIIITVTSMPNAAIIGNDTSLCKGLSTTLIAAGGENFLWNTGDTTFSIEVHPQLSTLFSMIAINDYCRDTATFQITVNPTPEIQISQDTLIYIGDTISINASGGTNYIWDNGDTSSSIIINPLFSGTYCLTVIDTTVNNCSSFACVNIEVVPRPCGNIFIPSMFSPNIDGNNDIFFVRGNCIKEIFLTIYNRWGQKIFETDKQSEGWDGTFKGMGLNTGVFVYYVQIKLEDGEVINKKGNITLVR